MGYSIGEDGVIVRTPNEGDTKRGKTVEKKKYVKVLIAAIIFFILSVALGVMAYLYYMESVYWKNYSYTLRYNRADAYQSGDNQIYVSFQDEEPYQPE